MDQYTVSHLKKDGYLEAATSGLNISNTANVRPTTDQSYYKAYGDRVAIAQHTQYGSSVKKDEVRLFAVDGRGQIIGRCDGEPNKAGNGVEVGDVPGANTQRYAYVNGQQYMQYDEHDKLDVLCQVTGFSSGPGVGSNVVQEGDSLRSIAQAVYGNSSLWYVIAKANALEVDAPLSIGMTLSVPSVTTSQNDATTMKPYNPGEIQGRTTPSLPTIAPPPPPPKNHCNVVAAIIVIAVIVVAAFVRAWPH